MKRLMEHYGGVVMAMVLAIGLMGVFFQVSIGGYQGVPAAIGSVIETVVLKEDYKLKTGAAFDFYRSVCGPKVMIKDNYVLKANQEVYMADWVMATDASGSEIPVSILKVWKDGQEDISQIYDDQKLLFQKAGTYWIELEATDAEGRNRSVLTNVFVNER